MQTMETKVMVGPPSPFMLSIIDFLTSNSVISAFLSLLCCVIRQNLLTPPLACSFPARASPTRNPPVFPLPRSSSLLNRATLSWHLSVCNCCHIFSGVLSFPPPRRCSSESGTGLAGMWRHSGAMTEGGCTHTDIAIQRRDGEDQKKVVRGHRPMWTGLWECLPNMVINRY